MKFGMENWRKKTTEALRVSEEIGIQLDNELSVSQAELAAARERGSPENIQKYIDSDRAAMEAEIQAIRELRDRSREEAERAIAESNRRIEANRATIIESKKEQDAAEAQIKQLQAELEAFNKESNSRNSTPEL